MSNHIKPRQLIGRKVITYDQLDSTNQEAIKWLSKTDPIEGTAIMTDYQDGGRGQFDRSWHSEKGQNILMSVILKPQFLRLERQFDLNIMTSVGVSEFLESQFHLEVKIKWPNDIYCSDKKISGILIQNFLAGKTIRHTVVGIGVNLNQQQFPPDLPLATSVFIESNRISDLPQSRLQLLANLDETYQRLKKDRDRLEKAYTERLYGRGERRWFQGRDGAIEGVLTGVDDNGKLKVQLENGIATFDNHEIKMIV